MMKARIVIVDYNSQDYLRGCIEALGAQTDKRFEAVIVNNGEAPIIYREEWRAYDWLSVIETGRNTGFAGGSNVGAQGANTEWIITLNPDARPLPDWFATLMQAAEDHPDYAMLSSTLLQHDTPALLDGAGEVYSIFGLSWRGGHGHPVTDLPIKNRNVLGPCGAAAAYRRRIFEEASGFDEAYFCFLEDIDLALRLQLKGYTCLHIASACVRHIGGGSSDGSGSAFQIYQSYKNQIRVIVKTAPWLFLLPQITLYYMSQLWFTLRAAREPHWRARIRGLRHGFLSTPKTLLKERRAVQETRQISLGRYWALVSKSPPALRRKDIIPR